MFMSKKYLQYMTILINFWFKIDKTSILYKYNNYKDNSMSIWIIITIFFYMNLNKYEYKLFQRKFFYYQF